MRARADDVRARADDVRYQLVRDSRAREKRGAERTQGRAGTCTDDAEARPG